MPTRNPIADQPLTQEPAAPTRGLPTPADVFVVQADGLGEEAVVVFAETTLLTGRCRDHHSIAHTFEEHTQRLRRAQAGLATELEESLFPGGDRSHAAQLFADLSPDAQHKLLDAVLNSSRLTPQQKAELAAKYQSDPRGAMNDVAAVVQGELQHNPSLDLVVGVARALRSDGRLSARGAEHMQAIAESLVELRLAITDLLSAEAVTGDTSAKIENNAPVYTIMDSVGATVAAAPKNAQLDEYADRLRRKGFGELADVLTGYAESVRIAHEKEEIEQRAELDRTQAEVKSKLALLVSERPDLARTGEIIALADGAYRGGFSQLSSAKLIELLSRPPRNADMYGLYQPTGPGAFLNLDASRRELSEERRKAETSWRA